MEIDDKFAPEHIEKAKGLINELFKVGEFTFNTWRSAFDDLLIFINKICFLGKRF